MTDLNSNSRATSVSSGQGTKPPLERRKVLLPRHCMARIDVVGALFLGTDGYALIERDNRIPVTLHPSWEPKKGESLDGLFSLWFRSSAQGTATDLHIIAFEPKVPESYRKPRIRVAGELLSATLDFIKVRVHPNVLGRLETSFDLTLHAWPEFYPAHCPEGRIAVEGRLRGSTLALMARKVYAVPHPLPTREDMDTLEGKVPA